MTTISKRDLLDNLSAQYNDVVRNLDSATIALIEKEDGSAALLAHPNSSAVAKAVELQCQIKKCSE